MGIFLVLFVYLSSVSILLTNADGTPVVLWHGMGDSCVECGWSQVFVSEFLFGCYDHLNHIDNFVRTQDRNDDCSLKQTNVLPFAGPSVFKSVWIGAVVDLLPLVQILLKVSVKTGE